MVSPVRGDYRRCQAETPLIVLCRFPGPALFGDVLGAHIYGLGGFILCVLSIVFVYALILPATLLIPRYIIATRDL
jgi:hypothetical protein